MRYHPHLVFLGRIESSVTKRDYYNSKGVTVDRSVIVHKSDHGASSSYQAAKEFFCIFMSLENSCCNAIVNFLNLNKDFSLMLSRILFQNIKHGILDYTSPSLLNICYWNIIERASSEGRGRINHHPLFVSPFITNLASPLTSFNH